MYPPIRINTVMMLGILLTPAMSHSTNDKALSIKIVSPQNGQTVSQTFEVDYEFKNKGKADQIDVFLDGIYQKAFKGSLQNVPPGKHEILIKATTDEDGKSANWDRVEVIVK